MTTEPHLCTYLSVEHVEENNRLTAVLVCDDCGASVTEAELARRLED